MGGGRERRREGEKEGGRKGGRDFVTISWRWQSSYTTRTRVKMQTSNLVPSIRDPFQDPWEQQNIAFHRDINRRTVSKKDWVAGNFVPRRFHSGPPPPSLAARFPTLSHPGRLSTPSSGSGCRWLSLVLSLYPSISISLCSLSLAALSEAEKASVLRSGHSKKNPLEPFVPYRTPGRLRDKSKDLAGEFLAGSPPGYAFGYLPDGVEGKWGTRMLSSGYGDSWKRGGFVGMCLSE